MPRLARELDLRSLGTDRARARPLKASDPLESDQGLTLLRELQGEGMLNDFEATPPASVVLVDDDPTVLRAFARALSTMPYSIDAYTRACDAIDRVMRGGVAVVVSDISLPDRSGVELLRAVRRHDPDLPVILVTGLPAMESAVGAVEHGAYQYLIKPVHPEALRACVERASKLHQLAQLKREAQQAEGMLDGSGDDSELEASFDRALDTLWIAFQPIVCPSSRTVFGYEALLRSNEPTLPTPRHLLDAAERLGALEELGRTIRQRACEPWLGANWSSHLLVNLHPQDLVDPALLDAAAPLSGIARQVVLELTERAQLENIGGVRNTVRQLREMGFRIAVDDLGVGYAGLSTFALLEPEIAKLDITLVRDVDSNAIKRKVIASMASLCKDMGVLMVAEGVETAAERDVLIELGCDLLQGYFFARPGPAFPSPAWDPDP